jgi:hypothetical protein
MATRWHSFIKEIYWERVALLILNKIVIKLLINLKTFQSLFIKKGRIWV